MMLWMRELLRELLILLMMYGRHDTDYDESNVIDVYWMLSTLCYHVIFIYFIFMFYLDIIILCIIFVFMLGMYVDVSI